MHGAQCSLEHRLHCNGSANRALKTSWKIKMPRNQERNSRKNQHRVTVAWAGSSFPTDIAECYFQSDCNVLLVLLKMVVSINQNIL